MIPVVILNGPNLNMLGTREPEIYGHETLADIEAHCRHKAAGFGMQLDFYQTNIEGELVSLVQQTKDKAKGLIINPGAYGHTSIALMDAVLGVSIPSIEVHLSNIHKREPFRHHTYLSQAVKGVICGFGALSYLLALEALHSLLKPDA